MSDDKKSNKGIVGCLFVLALPLLVFADAAAFSLMWRWFVVPLGVHSFGLASIVGFFRVSRAPTAEEKERAQEMTTRELLGGILTPMLGKYGMAFGGAAIAHWMMT